MKYILRILSAVLALMLMLAATVSASASGTFTQGLWRGQDPRVFQVKSTGYYYYLEDTVDGVVMFRSKSLVERSGPDERRVMPAGFPLCTPVYIEEMNGVTYNRWYAFGLDTWECDGDPYTGNWTNIGSLNLGGWTLDHYAFKVESGEYAGNWYYVWAGGEDKTNKYGFSAENIHLSKMLSPTELETRGDDLSDVILFCAKSNGWSGWDVEAPVVIQKDGTITMIYSGTDCKSSRYALGLCVCTGDPSDPASWVDLNAKTPAFYNYTEGEPGTPYGTGVASVVKSADGTEDWFYYHSKLYYDIPAAITGDKEAWARIINLKKIEWTTTDINGVTYPIPDLGTPVMLGETLALPSGDPGVSVKAEYLFEAEHAVPFGTIYNAELQQRTGDDGEPYNLMFEGIHDLGMSLDGCMRHFDWFAAGDEGDGTSGLHFRNLPESKSITIRAACMEANAGFDVLVNGEKVTSVSFTPDTAESESFTYQFADYRLDIDIPQGATLTLRHNKGEHADAAVDYIVFHGEVEEPVIEVETEPTDEPVTNQQGSNTWWVWILVGAALIFLGFAIIFVSKKK